MSDQPLPIVSSNGYADIIARLEKATGPDRELDAEIMCAIGGARRISETAFYGPGEKSWSFGECENESNAWCGPLPYVTASLDAALSLVGERLPGWAGLLGVLGTASKQGATLMSPIKETGEDEYGSPVDLYDEAYGEAATAPLAVLLALSRALEGE